MMDSGRKFEKNDNDESADDNDDNNEDDDDDNEIVIKMDFCQRIKCRLGGEINLLIAWTVIMMLSSLL